MVVTLRLCAPRPPSQARLPLGGAPASVRPHTEPGSSPVVTTTHLVADQPLGPSAPAPRPVWRGFALAGALALASAGCGGGGGGSVADFCRVVEEVNEGGGEASPDDIDRVVDAAPDEIKDDVRQLADALEESQENPENALAAFDDVQEASERVTTFQREKCGDPGNSVPEAPSTDTGGTDTTVAP